VVAKVKAATVKPAGFDPYVATLLGKITVGKQELSFRKGEKIFSQGDLADSIYFIQTGRIKIAVVSAGGKEAVLAMTSPHIFLVKGRLSTSPNKHGKDSGTINCIPDREASDNAVSSRAARAF
jgi:CRP/FNR family transcriptional regulator, cyclic AMP receptor protein